MASEGLARRWASAAGRSAERRQILPDTPSRPPRTLGVSGPEITDLDGITARAQEVLM